MIKFCNVCGHAVSHHIPEGDNFPRAVCPACGTIQYQNPKFVVGCIPEWEDKILICKRAIEPRYGKWTLPAGYMENGETTTEGAAREALEDAHARVEVHSLYTCYSVPHISQVYLLFRAKLLDLDFSAGSESLEVKLVSEHEVPWEELAFASVRRTLKHFFDDRRAGRFEARFGDIRPPER